MSKKTLADVKAKKSAHVIKVHIQLDGALATEIEDVETELHEARRHDRRLDSGMDSKAPGIQKRLDELRDKAKDSVETFEFKPMQGGSYAFDELVRKHPPTEAEMKDQPGINFSPAGIAPELIAASCVSHEMTPEEVVELYESSDWSPAELNRLFNAAFAANNTTPEIPFIGSGTDVTMSSV